MPSITLAISTSCPPTSEAMLCHRTMKEPLPRVVASTQMRERRMTSSGCEWAKTATIISSQPCTYFVTGLPLWHPGQTARQNSMKTRALHGRTQANRVMNQYTTTAILPGNVLAASPWLNHSTAPPKREFQPKNCPNCTQKCCKTITKLNTYTSQGLANHCRADRVSPGPVGSIT
eukprot:169491-Rhodomonas_salina.1